MKMRTFNNLRVFITENQTILDLIRTEISINQLSV